MLSLEEYIEYIKKKHNGQTRKQGTPYYLHPLEVCNILKENGFPFEYQVTGLFHDLLEDTDTTYDEIREISNAEIAEAVRLVTKEKGYSMQEYIDRISKNEIAKMVKLADRLHNISETHLASKEFQEKYIKETEDWYMNLVKGTVFEDKIKNELDKLKEDFKMDCKLYLIYEKRLCCQFDSKSTYEYVEEKWVKIPWTVVSDKLIGYDPSDGEIGDTDILSSIKEISIDEVIQEYGQEVIEKLKDIIEKNNS